MDYTLITANRNYSSWSLRPWVLMKALGIPFADRVEPFTGPSNYTAFRTFAPNGQVPALIHGQRTIWDSLAIILYLADRHENIWPADEAPRAFAQSATAEMHSGFAALRDQCPMNVGVRVAPNPPGTNLTRDIARIAEIFTHGLETFGGPYLTGPKFTAIDAFFAPVAYRIRTYGLDVGRGREWTEHIIQHDAMRAWEREALAEEWREISHEEELQAAGSVTADYRTG